MLKTWNYFYIVNDTCGCRKGTILIRRGLVDAVTEETFETVPKSLKAKSN